MPRLRYAPVIALVACLVLVQCTTPAAVAPRVSAQPPKPSESLPTPEPGQVLSERQVVDRCRPQLNARSGEPGFRGIRHAELGLAYDRDYRTGDLVRLVDTRSIPREILTGYPTFPHLLCRILGGADIHRRVPSREIYAAATSDYGLKELCAETYGVPQRPKDGGWLRPDLRHAEISALSTRHGTTVALLAMDGGDHGCVIESAPRIRGAYSVPDEPVRGYRTWFVPQPIPRASDRDSHHWVYVTWGRVPPGADSLRFIRTDGTVATVEVSDDGSYAMVVKDSADRLSGDIRYEFTRGADVLGSGPAIVL